MTYTWITANGTESTITGDLGNQVISYNYLSTSAAAQSIDLAINAASTTVTGIPGISSQTIDNTVEGVAFFGNTANDTYTFTINSGATTLRHIEIRSESGDDSVIINGDFSALDSRSGGVSYGTNFFDGGSGYDTVTIPGNQADYIVEDTADTDTRRRFLIRDAGSGNEEHLDLYDIEKIVFADGSQYIGTSTDSISGGSSGGGGGSSSSPAATTAAPPTPAATSATPPTTSATPTPTQESPVLGIQPQETVTTVQLATPLTLGNLQVTQAVVGTPQNDVITGSDEGEAIAGGKGKDQMTGGGGPDAFIFETPGEFGKKSADVITDFNPDQGDKVVIASDAFEGVSKINFTSVTGKGNAKDAASSNKNFIYDDKTGVLYFNENGRKEGLGDGGEFVKLMGAPEIAKGDFIIA